MYSEKYFKYKQKYLELKKQVGGVVVNYPILDDTPDDTAILITFDEKNIDNVIAQVLKQAQTSTYLKGLTKNYSAEKGFDLPLTDEWREQLRNNPLLKRAGYRTLRFRVKNGNVISLRYMDDLHSWNENELTELDGLIESIVN